MPENKQRNLKCPKCKIDLIQIGRPTHNTPVVDQLPYNFEKILDECGFSFHQCLDNNSLNSKIKLWKIDFLETT